MELSIFLQAAAQPAGSSWTMPAFMVAIFIVMYFFMIRPQQKKQKEAKKRIEEMQKGDKIVTIAGIHGIINKINDDGTMQLETSPGSYLKIEKSTISPEWTANLNKVATVDTKK